MVTDDHRKKVAKAYQLALAELRQKHDNEFHEILARIYVEQGIAVRKRESRLAARHRMLVDASTVVAATVDPSS